MKISLNWLKDYVAINLSADDLAHKLTMAGLEVEAIHSVGDDKIFEIEVTPNRADCLNMIGIAREVSAILNKPRKGLKSRNVKYPKFRNDIKIIDKKGCQQYMGVLIENVSIGVSPEWIRTRLASVGIRSISNIVDITNFVLMETGQPLHAFDYDKLIGRKIIVRRAQKGEKILAIDEAEHELDESVLIIADEKRPVAIAGIMGGKETEVTAETKNILLESAYFDPVLIRRSSRRLGLSSDSSYRFERGVDIEGIKLAMDRAVSLILELASGKIIGFADINVNAKAKKRQTIKVSFDKINGYLGADISANKITAILRKMDFKVSFGGKNTLLVTPPTTRRDITCDVDIVEEVARIQGYDILPTSLPRIKLTDVPQSASRQQRAKIKDAFIAQGFNEIVTYSTINQDSLDKVSQGPLFSTKIINPLSLDQEMMRPTILPSLLNVVTFNFNRGQENLKLFEIGKIYIKEDEIETLGVVMTGVVVEDWREAKIKSADFFDLKGVVSRSLGQIIAEENISFSPAEETIFEAGKAANIRINNVLVGVAGKIDDNICQQFDIKGGEIWFAQIDLHKVYAQRHAKMPFSPISAYPRIVRDISFTFNETIPFDKILETIRKVGSKILIEINLKEEYTQLVRERIDPNHRGILLSLVYQSPERTLQEIDVQEDHQIILNTLVEKFKIVIR